MGNGGQGTRPILHGLIAVSALCWGCTSRPVPEYLPAIAPLGSVTGFSYHPTRWTSWYEHPISWPTACDHEPIGIPPLPDRPQEIEALPDPSDRGSPPETQRESEPDSDPVNRLFPPVPDPLRGPADGQPPKRLPTPKDDPPGVEPSAGRLPPPRPPRPQRWSALPNAMGLSGNGCAERCMEGAQPIHPAGVTAHRELPPSGDASVASRPPPTVSAESDRRKLVVIWGSARRV
jgi:hypothetical protein